MRRKYLRHSDKLKFKVALEALKGNKAVPEMCQEFGIASSQIYDWKKQLEEYDPSAIFGSKNSTKEREAEIGQLHAIIGKLKVENDFLERVLNR